MIFSVSTLAALVVASPALAFPPLSCDGRVDGAFWGVELLGNVAVLHSEQMRQSFPIKTTLPLPGPGERVLFVIEDRNSVHLAVATETDCEGNDTGFPVSLRMLSPDDPDIQVRTACCTAAE